MAPLAILGIAQGLAQFAPVLMKFFGAGQSSIAVAERVAGIAQTVTGAATPEQALAMIQQEAAKQLEFNLEVMKNETALEMAYLTDIQSARGRDIELTKIKGGNFRGDVLAYLAIGALISVIISLFFSKELPDSSEKLLYTVLGALVMIVKDVYSFEFGASKGSERNAQMAADALKP